ncbi:MAG: response regulator [Bdellovibrionota bacterium]
MGVSDPGKGVVLVVDDSEDMRSLLTVILGKNYKIVQAENGKVALDLLDKQDVDVIVLDENMPIMGGHECYVKLREKSNFTPVIFCTGAPSEEFLKRELALGAFDYLAKPVDADKLLQLVDEAFTTKQRLRLIRARAK